MGNKDEPMDESALCAACGLCCNGTLFAIVPLNEGDDIAALSAAGASCGQDRLELPCPAHVAGQGCGIYARRPKLCREFDCMILGAYRRREITLAEALATIAEAIALKQPLMAALERIEPEIPALPVLWRQWDKLAKGADGLAFRQTHGTVLMQLAALTHCLERHFRPGVEEEDQAGKSS